MGMVIVNNGIGKCDGIREDEEHKVCKGRVSGEDKTVIQKAENGYDSKMKLLIFGRLLYFGSAARS